MLIELLKSILIPCWTSFSQRLKSRRLGKVGYPPMMETAYLSAYAFQQDYPWTTASCVKKSWRTSEGFIITYLFGSRKGSVHLEKLPGGCDILNLSVLAPRRCAPRFWGNADEKYVHSSESNGRGRAVPSTDAGGMVLSKLQEAPPAWNSIAAPADWFDNRFRSFDLSHLARESSYGDDLCVQVAAHLMMMRAIHVLIDMEDSEWSWNLEGAGS